MNHRNSYFRSLPFLFIFAILLSCHTNKNTHDEKGSVKPPAPVDEHVGTDLRQMLEFANNHEGRLNDTTVLVYRSLLDSLYNANGYNPLWSDKKHWLSQADSLFSFIAGSKAYGLFPGDYHFPALAFIHRVIDIDTNMRKNASIWARADLLYTDAFFTLVKHLKQGRLAYDSVTLRKDTILPTEIFTRTLSAGLHADSMRLVLEDLQPKHAGYDSLKSYLTDFLSTAKFRRLTYIEYPYKDSVKFIQSLTARLREVGYFDSSVTDPDTAQLAEAIRNYQRANKLKVTGKANQNTVNMMDNSDWEKFKRIAINLDRYKLLPDSLPKTYVWVNLPSFYLQVVDSDSVALESRIICGAPKTRTPLLTSEISNFVTFPQWTVPSSIIFKEMLPQIKRNVDYLRKQNLMVVDANDSVRDPLTIKWARLNKNNFPYQLKQRQGDDNSLGVMKFNFRNKYDVYLHDTNARWIFGETFRALSHGCVRVKEWQKLADFLVRNDSVRYKPDTLRAWIKRQEKHTVYGFPRVPIYLRYFTAVGRKGHIVFFDDIYGEDKQLRERYFADKAIY